jgi:HPr kinase/phosphorylase
LVADDQCMIEAVHGRLIAACPPALSGLAEIRGLGLVTIRKLPAIVIDLVVCLVDQAEITRMPESKFSEISGVRLPCFDLPARQIAVSLPILTEILENRRV